MFSVNRIVVVAIIGVISMDFSFANPLSKGELSLMRFMTSSRDLTQRNPERSLTCFDYYIPILNKITEDYEASYAACLKSADEQRLQIDENTRPQREEIEASATGACNALQACSQSSSSIPYFECYVNQGSENTKVMYAISANASEILANVQEDYRQIDNSQYKCTNASERAYVQDTASTYEELQACLQGKSPVPTPGPSTPEPTTPESSTPEPSTPESSTPEPSTPESSTPEPSTPESSTPEPTTPESSSPEPTTPEQSTEPPATSEDPTAEPSSTTAPVEPEDSSTTSASTTAETEPSSSGEGSEGSGDNSSDSESKSEPSSSNESEVMPEEDLTEAIRKNFPKLRRSHLN